MSGTIKKVVLKPKPKLKPKKNDKMAKTVKTSYKNDLQSKAEELLRMYEETKDKMFKYEVLKNSESISFTEEELINILDYWNSSHPGETITSSDPNKIWRKLREKYEITDDKLFKHKLIKYASSSGNLEEHMIDVPFITDTLIAHCGLKINTLRRIIFEMKRTGNMAYCFSQIIINPYEFIQPTFHLLTHKRAEAINEMFDLNIPMEIRYEKWIHFYILEEEKSLWISKYDFEQKCFQYLRKNNSEKSELLQKVKKEVCIEQVLMEKHI